MSTNENAIEVNGLVKEFKNGPRAVDGVDLYVAPGEIYGFLGPNGAGKSTTVKMLVTLLPPSGGRAVVGGFDVARRGAEVRRIIGCALQEAALDPVLTGREHFILQGGLHGFSRKEAAARGEELLERVGLSGAADRKAGTYSGGMRRRLDLGLALVHSPKIVFLDEPTTGLDPQSRAALWDEVRRLVSEEGVTIFLTTQYLEEADVLANRVGIIDYGRLVAEGTPAQLKAQIGRPTVEVVPGRPEDRPRIESVLARFGEPARTARDAVAVRLRETRPVLAEIVRALDAAQAGIEDITLRAPTLDDVFLSKTGRSLGAEEEPEPEVEPEIAPEEELRVAVRGRSRIERVPTGLLKEWMAERRVQQAAPAAPALEIRTGSRAGQRMDVHDKLLLGREDGDLVIPDPEVSRRHAVLRVVEGSLVIEDLQSLNGTWVNTKRITIPTLVEPGDVIKVGTTEIEVESARSRERVPSQTPA